MKLMWLLKWVFLCISVASFASGPISAPKLPESFLPVPLVRQATSYSCGAAALLGILYYWKVSSDDETSLYDELQTTPENGTAPDNIVKVARQFGLQAYKRENLNLSDLRKALKRGQTVILSLQAWRDSDENQIPWRDTWEDGHYIVLVAMDQQYAYAMDPSASGGLAYVPLRELVERWHDYEDREGHIWRYDHLGIFIRGESALKTLPGPLIRME